MEENMKPQKKLRGLFVLLLLLIMNGIGGGLTASAEFAVGKTYDRSNYQEIQDLLISPVLNWVKIGDFVIETAELEYEWKSTQADWIKATEKNAGDYEIGPEDYTIEKTTGERASFIYGFPYPNPDSRDPNVAIKVMENFQIQRSRVGGYYPGGEVSLVGRGGLEKQLVSAGTYLYYRGREDGPIVPNTDNYQAQTLTYTLEPYDIRGVTQMRYIYNDNRQDANWSYLPMLRRIRRVSAASPSDPFMGSDLCVDDSQLWGGKNQTFDWKYLGEKTILCAFLSTKIYHISEKPDGSMTPYWHQMKMGYQTPGWQGVPWSPTNLIWIKRPCWIIEGLPQDPYYNYGRQIFYVDKVSYSIYFKVVYNKAGEYWKTSYSVYTKQVAPSGREIFTVTDFNHTVDDKTRHASHYNQTMIPGRNCDVTNPLKEVGPHCFTMSAMYQFSK